MFGDPENSFGSILDHLDTFEAFLRKKIFTFFQIFSSVFMPKTECFDRELSLRDLKKSIFQKVDLILKIHPVKIADMVIVFASPAFLGLVHGARS